MAIETPARVAVRKLRDDDVVAAPPAVRPFATAKRPAQLIRQRLTRVVTCGFATGFVIEGITRILPLYLVQEFGLSNAGVARVMSLRVLGITVGVISLGALADRWGTKRLTTFALVGCGVCTALLGVAPLPWFLVLIALLSGMLSTAFVNLNHLTQLVDVRRQGMTNTLYRAVGTVAGILAPLVVTRLIGVMAGVFAAMAVGLVLAALWMRSYPMEEQPEAFRGWREEGRAVWALYRAALAEQRLMRFLHLSSVWLGLTSVVLTFFAIRLTKELGASTQLYGNACAIGAGATLAGILALGPLLDRVSLKRCVVTLAAVSSLCVAGLGLSAHTNVSVALFVGFTACNGMLVGPASMWISREAQHAGLGAAFSMQKVLMTMYPAVMMLVFGALEPWLGIHLLMLTAGGLSFGVGLLMWWLPTPPASLHAPVDNIAHGDMG